MPAIITLIAVCFLSFFCCLVPETKFTKNEIEMFYQKDSLQKNVDQQVDVDLSDTYILF